MAASKSYEFGPFHLEVDEKQLLRDGQAVPLTPKAFDLLLALVENSGHLVEKDELLKRIWPDSFVEEANLSVNMTAVRRALGEGPNDHHYIETVPRRGYRFVADVRQRSDNGAKSDDGARQVGSRSFVEYFAGEVRRHKPVAFVGLAALLGLIGALGYGIYRRFATHESNAHFQKVRFSRLTTNGHVNAATVSPDGKFIGYVQLEDGKYSLWTKAVSTDSALQIVQSSEGERIFYLTFSPDSSYLYYAVVPLSGTGVLYRIPVLGGTPKKFSTTIASPVTFSPDGGQLAFVRSTRGRSLSDSGETHLIVVNADGSGERIVARSASDEGFSAGGPSWSPDGTIIATGLGRAGVPRQWIVAGVVVESGEVKPLSRQSWNYVGKVAWFRDGTGLVLIATERQGDKQQIWQLSYPEGAAHPVTNDLNAYFNLSLTADSNALVTIQSQPSSNIWVAPNGDAGQARQITFSSVGEGNVAWTPEGSIVYSSKAGGDHSNLWIMNGDGGNPRRLTDSPAEDYLPDVSPDGRYIVFISTRSGKENIWRVDMDGGNPKQLTNEVAHFPVFAPDGRWIVCTMGQYNKRTLWRVPVDGGSPVQLTDTSAYIPAVSSDGKLIAYAYFEGEKTKVAIIPFEGGPPVKVLDYTPTDSGLQWSPDDSSLIYVDARQDGANLWRLPLDGSPAQKLTDFKSEQIFDFSFTRDGRQLICVRGTTTKDVIMIGEEK